MQRQTAPDSQSSLVELEVDITGPPVERDVYTARVRARVATGEEGEEKDVFRIPLRPWEVEVIANPSLLGSAVQRSSATISADPVMDVGARLFGALFAGRAGRLYRRAVDATARSGRGLRFRLRLTDGPVAALPWEYLYDPEIRNDFIALSTDWSLVRQHGQVLPDDAGPVTPPIRILALTGEGPEGLEVDHDLSLLEDLAAGNPDVSVTMVRNPTRAQFLDACRRERYHLLHYAGTGLQKGGVGTGSHEQTLLVGDVDVTRGADLAYGVDGGSLFPLLTNKDDLRVVFLSGCHTDWLAADLARGGPAVVGLRGLVSVDACLSFSKQFYRHLFDGRSFGTAVSAGRRQVDLDRPGSREWGNLVCYLGRHDRILLYRGQETPASSRLSAPASPAVVRDPDQEELAFLTRKLAVIETNLATLRQQMERLGDASPAALRQQLDELEGDVSRTSTRVEELGG